MHYIFASLISLDKCIEIRGNIWLLFLSILFTDSINIDVRQVPC